MQAASLLDGFSFDLFPPFENGLAAPEVDVSRRQVVQALVVSTVVVVPDELLDALFELSWQVVVVQQDPVFHRAMISLDLALRHRVVRPAADMSDAVVLEPLAKGIVPAAVELGKEALPTLSRSARGARSAKESTALTPITTPSALAPVPSLETAWQDVDSSFERFCLTAGIGAIEQMLCEDAQQLAGAPHNRNGGRVGHRWGRTKGKIGFHGGKVAVHRPRVRSYDGHEVALPTWRAAQAEDWLGRWAMSLMLINVSTRKLRRAVRLPEGDLPVIAGDGTSKSAASRRFVALSAERLAEWMTSDLSKLDLLVIQIDGLHIGNDLVLVAALGIDADGHKHPLALIEGATENAAVVQALIDNLIERGLDPKVCRLFIIDGAKALSKVIRRTFGAHTPIQRCQLHKARNVIE